VGGSIVKRKKHRRRDHSAAGEAVDAEVPIRKLLKIEGKLVHGTRGKAGHGPRGNKKYS
jgi:hypothetical protein